MIPDFPHNIRIRLSQLNFFCCVLTLLCLCPVGCLILLYLYYEESLVSSNLNSKLFRFHCVRPNLHTVKIILYIDFRFGSLWHHFYIGYVYHKIYAFLACVSYKNYLPCDVSYCSYFIHWKYFHDCSSVFWAICIGMSYARGSYQKDNLIHCDCYTFCHYL